jgi:CheY-like chemotaxis protein
MSMVVYFLDDEESFCEIFDEFMTSLGYDASVFIDHKEALQEVKKRPPDVICIDYRLKGITGDEVAKQIPDSAAKILLTGELHFKNEHLFDAHLNKPFRLPELKVLIDKVHERKLSSDK